MAEITMEGSLWIELADVYTWIESRGTKTENAKSIRFSVENDALVMEYQDTLPPVEIDAAEFWTWVIDICLPKGVAHYETVFGVPQVQETDLVINFAAGSGNDPRSWGGAPACLSEWERASDK